MRRDLLRTAFLTAAGLVLGIGVDALSARPLRIFDAQGPGAWPERAPRATVDELRRWLELREPLAILDVRSRKAFETGHAPEAFNAPGPRFLQEYAQQGLGPRLRGALRILVICESERCPAADRVAAQLEKLGHAGVQVLHGGWSEYSKAGLRQVPP